MRYGTVVPGRFLSRPNRFIARVEMPEGVETVHVKNTGRCRELLIPGTTVYLEKAENPARRTQYDLIAVEKGNRVINMDAQAPNRVFGEWAAAGGFLPEVTAIQPEFSWGESRLDFCLKTPRGMHLVEVTHWKKVVRHVFQTLLRNEESNTSENCSRLWNKGLTPPCFLWYKWKAFVQ